MGCAALLQLSSLLAAWKTLGLVPTALEIVLLLSRALLVHLALHVQLQMRVIFFSARTSAVTRAQKPACNHQLCNYAIDDRITTVSLGCFLRKASRVQGTNVDKYGLPASPLSALLPEYSQLIVYHGLCSSTGASAGCKDVCWSAIV